MPAAPTRFYTRRPSPWGALIAASLGVGVAATAVYSLASHPAQMVPPAAPQMLPPPPAVAEAAPATPAADAPVSSRVEADKELALRLFDVSPRRGGTQVVEAGLYGERKFEVSNADEIKSINVQSKCGDVIVIHNTDRDVVVLAGKAAVGPDTARARQFARNLRYELSKDGDKISVSLSGAQETPNNIYAVTRAIVIAPSSVVVTTSSGR